MVPLVLVLATGSDKGASEYEVRTFDIDGTANEMRQALALVRPYVDEDRGSVSTGLGAITVRETPDNLDRIARVLADLGYPETTPPSFSLQFQLVEANGTSESDQAIADLVGELRKTLRFDFYSLVGEAQIAVMPGANFEQVLRTPTAKYDIRGRLLEWSGSGYTLSLTLSGNYVKEESADSYLGGLKTYVGIRKGQTLVLGTVPVEGSATLLLVVKLTEA